MILQRFSIFYQVACLAHWQDKQLALKWTGDWDLFFFLKTTLEYDIGLTFNISNSYGFNINLPVWVIAWRDFFTIEDTHLEFDLGVTFNTLNSFCSNTKLPVRVIGW